MSLKLISASVIAFSLCGFAAPSFANDVTVSAGKRSVKVSFTDLNVRSEAGAEALLARIDQAAQTVCGPQPDRTDDAATYSFNTCMLVAVDGAVAQVGDVLFADAGQGSSAAVATE